jgi:hypothetical protein
VDAEDDEVEIVPNFAFDFEGVDLPERIRPDPTLRN